jgi:hypothetical protein
MTPPPRFARPPKGQRWPTGKAGSAAFWFEDTRADEHITRNLFGNAS